MNNPFKEVEYFENDLCKYTKAPYCVAVDSCTNALFLTLKYFNVKNKVTIFPRKTYLSMPMMALANDNTVYFREYEWRGYYQIEVPEMPNLIIYDSAKRLRYADFREMAVGARHDICDSETCNNHKKMVVLKSFHMKKHITSISGKGGAILTNDEDFYNWALKARWEGREPYSDYKDKEQDISIIGYNMNMTPEEAVFLRRQLSTLSVYQKDLDEPDGYRNLDEFTIFKDCKVIHKNCSSESLIAQLKLPFSYNEKNQG